MHIHPTSLLSLFAGNPTTPLSLLVRNRISLLTPVIGNQIILLSRLVRKPISTPPLFSLYLGFITLLVISVLRLVLQRGGNGLSGCICSSRLKSITAKRCSSYCRILAVEKLLRCAISALPAMNTTTTAGCLSCAYQHAISLLTPAGCI